MRKIFSLVLIFLMLFVGTVECFADSVRWKFTKKIRVYIPEHKNAQLVRKAFDEWTAKTNNKIMFYYIKNPSTADIKVVFVEKINSNDFNHAVGLTKSTFSGKFFIKTQIEIASKTQNDQYMSDYGMYIVALHEIGHAIGLKEHSPNNMSIMYAAKDDRQKISSEELNRLENLYGW